MFSLSSSCQLSSTTSTTTWSWYSPYITVTNFGKDHSHENSCTTVLYCQMFSELSSLYSASVFNRPTKQAVPVMRYWYGTIILFSLMIGELSIMFCRYKHLVGGNLGTAVTLGQLVVQVVLIVSGQVVLTSINTAARISYFTVNLMWYAEPFFFAELCSCIFLLFYEVKGQ